MAWFSLTEGIENCWLVSSNDDENNGKTLEAIAAVLLLCEVLLF